jgi:hypothetical protein
MIPYQRNMTQQATYWAPAANDGFGGKTFADPVLVMVRWQHSVNLSRSVDGREITTQNVVHVNQPVEARGYLALGNHQYVADPTTVDGEDVGEIVQVGRSPNLRGTIEITKAYV